MTPGTTHHATTPEIALKTSGWAVSSVILGLLGLLTAVTAGTGNVAAVALICALAAHRDIQRGLAAGKALNITGVCVAGLALVISIARALAA